ncbi:hypothetical protein GCM10027061_11220 [Nesterenkonia suensis]
MRTADPSDPTAVLPMFPLDGLTALMQRGLPPGSPRGKLWVRGLLTGRGRLNTLQATETSIIDSGWLRTSDLATYDPGGWSAWWRSSRRCRRPAPARSCATS